MTIDLRSDTVTRPDDAMRRAMASAEVGDDIYGEDPSARRLEEEVAERLGKEAALFVPSGTMGNQVALLVHCRPGDDVVVGEDAHCMLYESGAAAAIAGVQFSIAGQGGLFDVAELEAALRPASAYYMPRTRLVALEDTHNRGGGIVCFSKGLGAPVGSAVAGSRAAIDEARRMRKMLGGGMRQVGVLCAAALHALEHNLARLPEDHATARRLAEGVAALDGVSIALDAVQTNIVCFEVADAHDFVERARARGVWLNAMTPTTVRAVTHLPLGEAGIDRALVALAQNCKGARPVGSARRSHEVGEG